jgi:hypothetical protein
MDKITNMCGQPIQYASCVRYETPLPQFSNLTSECNSLESTTGDTYNLIGAIKNEIEMTVSSSCITYTEPKTVKSIIFQMNQELCAQKTRITNQDNLIQTLSDKIDLLQTQTCP